MDPRNIQTVLATEVDKFGAAPMNYAVSRPLLGEGIMNTDGARWKLSRQFINPIFTRAQVSELSTFEIHVRRMIDRIPRDGSTIDLQPLCKALYLDSTTEFIFGKSANSLSPETSNVIARRLPEIFDDALRSMLTRFLLSKFKFLARNEKAWARQCAEVHSIIDNYIEEDIEERKKAVESQDTPYKYVLLRELSKATHDKLFIRNELMNIFFPARDSAAVLTSNAVFLLARHPNEWNKARDEVLSIGAEKLTFEKLKSLKCVHHVINETLRMFSPVVRSWKTCLSPAVLPHGGGPLGKDPILLEAGDQVDMAFGSMHMDKDIYGSDAHEFKPDRWEGRKQDWGYIPFLGGRRICPARQNVLTDVSYVLVRLMQEFKACENRDPCHEYLSTQVFTKESRNGCKVSFVPA
ncbi:26ee98d6-363a-4914-8206-101c1f95f393 [Sclerotinia trifoliorum]|uniref:26ee98d6-363a-4914-8206-101c1f95f393 n=1 Tax=Sclerotinia trifoliorum TaxID=28548 RepID=A0A8H2VQ49_9HELO|nr:26ee98d6-363a-4914-8206-101c1f95f393 [Sclerotinia trifoliorum]